MKSNQISVKSLSKSVKVAFTLLALPLALSACTSLLRQPDPAAASNLTSAAFPTLLGQNANDPAGSSIASQGWSDFFTDPQLKQLIQLGLENNRDLRTAVLNVDKVRAQYQLARSSQFPTLGVNGGYATNGNKNSNTSTYTANLGLSSYEIDFWGRIANLKDSALQNFFSTQSARSTAQIALVSQIAQSYLAIAFDQEQLKLAQQTFKAQQDSYGLLDKQFKAGIISLQPLRQAEITLEQARLAAKNSETLIAQDRNGLALLVGQPVPDNLLPQGAITQITASQTLPAGLPSELLQHRPDIAGAEYTLKAKGADIAAARAAYFPSISLTGSVGYQSKNLSDLFKSGAFLWNIGPSINLPIFDGGARRANLDVARVDQKLALTAYEKSIQTAFREVSDELASRATLDDRLAAQDRLVKASTSNYDLSQARFKAGVDSYLNVLSAQQNLFTSQQAQITLKQQSLVSQVNLYKVLGGGAVNNIGLDAKPTNGNTTAAQVAKP